MTKEEQARELALFRFSLIAPVVSGIYKESSKMEYFRKATCEPHRLPDGKMVEFSPLTLKKWYQLYVSGGLDALIPHARIDTGKTRVLSGDACRQIHAYLEKYPHITGKMIYEKLITEGYVKEKDASASSVYRYLKSAVPERTGMPEKECLSYEFKHANDCWQADTTMGPVIVYEGKKRQTYLIAFIDDCSRLLLHGEFFFEDNALNMQKVFKKAIKKHGIPKRCYFDNGGPYRNTQLKWICASLGIVELYTKPYTPQGHGKIERSHRTMKDNFMHATDWNNYTTLDGLNESYNIFLNEKYNNALHSSIKKTPKERYLEDFERLRFAEVSQLEEHFLHRITRKVTATATVSLFNSIYETPQQFIKKTITIRYNPVDMAQIYIYDEETGRRLHCLRPLVTTDNVYRRRKTNIDYGRMDGGDTYV